VKEIIGRRIQDGGAAIYRRIDETVLLERLSAGMNETGSFGYVLGLWREF
jgi:hypothetical protein